MEQPALSRTIGALALGLVFAATATAARPPAIEGRMFARVSVTVDPDENGTIQVPSPFAVLPDGEVVAVHVPEADGILLLKAEQILHHFPVPGGVADDLAVAPGLLVAGNRPSRGTFTVALDLFDLGTRRTIDHVASANPYLRIDPGGESLWRAVIGDPWVGVYHPPSGASYPLWSRDDGSVPSDDQMARASAGIGFGGDGAWIPSVDGTISRRSRGRTVVFADVDHGDFLDAVGPDEVLLLAREITVRSDADGDALLPHHLHVRRLDAAGTVHDSRLVSIGGNVKAKRLVFHGRPVRVHGDRVYWIFLGRDFLEIRTADLRELAR